MQQFQVVQKSLDAIEAQLGGRPCTHRGGSTKLRAHVLEQPLAVSLAYVGEIARAARGRYEDFRCEIARPA